MSATDRTGARTVRWRPGRRRPAAGGGGASADRERRMDALSASAAIEHNDPPSELIHSSLNVSVVCVCLVADRVSILSIHFTVGFTPRGAYSCQHFSLPFKPQYCTSSIASDIVIVNYNNKTSCKRPSRPRSFMKTPFHCRVCAAHLVCLNCVAGVRMTFDIMALETYALLMLVANSRYRYQMQTINGSHMLRSVALRGAQMQDAKLK